MNEAMERALDKGPGSRFVDIGSVDAALDKSAGTKVYRSQYSVQPALHAPIETRSATAEFKKGRLTLWLATQAPESAKLAAAKAIGIDADNVTLIQMMAGAVSAATSTTASPNRRQFWRNMLAARCR